MDYHLNHWQLYKQPNAAESKGYTPAALNPAEMLRGTIASAQACENNSENWDQVTTFPGLFAICC